MVATVATANNRLYTFIEAADPTQSFIDLSLQLDEPVEEVSCCSLFVSLLHKVSFVVIYLLPCLVDFDGTLLARLGFGRSHTFDLQREHLHDSSQSSG